MYFCFVKNKKNILIAPLNWGLGHATRCIPIICTLEQKGFHVIIASDGDALLLLQKEFPHIKTIVLPSYNISYPKNGKIFLFHFIKKIPHFIKTIKLEKNVIKQLVKEEQIAGIISDNRFGVFEPSIPCVYITHQITVFSGFFTAVTSWVHQQIIKKYKQCWVPDLNTKNRFTEKLTQTTTKNNLQFIGFLSRFKKINEPIIYDVLVMLSGPEPQRSLLENKLLRILKKHPKKVLFVCGKMEQTQNRKFEGNLEIVNFMTSKELEQAINRSNIVLARSGYSSIMDLAVLQKKAFFIPTPGQFEQEYLAKRLEALKIAPYCEQDQFTLEALNEVSKYLGFRDYLKKDISSLFGLFEGK